MYFDADAISLFKNNNNYQQLWNKKADSPNPVSRLDALTLQAHVARLGRCQEMATQEFDSISDEKRQKNLNFWPILNKSHYRYRLRK